MSSSISNANLMSESWLQANRNEPKPILNRLIDYTGQSIGAFRFLQVIRGSLGLVNEIRPISSPSLQNLEKTAGGGMSALGVARLPSATQGAVSSLSQFLNEKNESLVGRKAAVAVKDTMDALTAWGHAVNLITGNPAFKAVAQWTDLTCDVADLGLSSSDYQTAEEFEELSEGNVKKAFASKKYHAFLSTAKSTVSVISGIFAAILFLTGAQLISTLAMIALSLSSALLAIRRDMYKSGLPHPLISFDDFARV